MASISDVFNAINDLKAKLDTLHADALNAGVKQDAANAKLDTLNVTVQGVGNAVGFQLGQVIQLGKTGNQLVHHLTLQQATVICLLEQISTNTCNLVNLATEQLAETRAIREHARVTAYVAEAANPGAALSLKEHDELRKQIAACCPPSKQPPPCQPRRCEDPGAYRGKVEPVDGRIG